MAEILTRTYTYDALTNKVVGESAVKLSQFTISGDNRPITQILSISASWYRYHDTSSTVTHAAELVFGDGSVLKSNSVSYRGDLKTFHIETSFMDMPDASAWDEENITLRTTLSTKLNHVYWYATAERPMVLTITYISSEFKPHISYAKLYRANSLGAAADDGTYLSFKATLSVEKTGTGGSGTFRIYSGDSAATIDTLVYSRSGISGSTGGVTISAAPISGLTVGSGEKKWFRMEFAYTATTESGISSEEIVYTAFLIGNVFTNVHLAGVSTGGVRFGGYSTAGEGTPKFECDYPAYLYGGIAQIGNGGANPLFVEAGEEISYGSTSIIFGYVTTSKTVVRLAVPVSRLLANVNSVHVTALSGYLRNDGGYGLTSSSASSDYLGVVTSAEIDRATNTVFLVLTSASALYLTNNAVVTFVPTDMTLQFD